MEANLKITKAELLDRLRRAYEMEEVMAADLLELAKPFALKDDVPVEKRSKVEAIISLIRSDTLEHRKIVHDLIQKLSGDVYGT
jgi:hypothetical protein